MKTLNFRPLGSTEKLFWILDQTSQVHFVIAAELHGKINSISLKDALASIQKRHPLLFSRIIENGFEHPYFEYVPSSRIPLRIIKKSQSFTLEKEMADELAKPFDYGNAPLIRCVLIEDPINPILLFAVHHAVSDGISMTLVINDIIKALGGLSLETSNMPLSIDQFLNPEFQQVIGSQKMVGAMPNPIFRRREWTPEVSLKKLKTELSARLLLRCKAERTTFLGLVYAAAISAARKANLRWSQSKIKVIIPISIRDSLTKEQSSALYINSKALFSEYPDSLTFWERARWFKSELTAVKDMETITNNARDARAKLFSETELGQLSDNLQLGVARELMISNLGKIRDSFQSNELKLKHIWGPLALSGTKDEITIGITSVDNCICISCATRIPESSFLNLLMTELENACVI